MALDLPAFERPANAISTPTSAGNCAADATLPMKRASLKRLIFQGLTISAATAVVYNSPALAHGSATGKSHNAAEHDSLLGETFCRSGDAVSGCASLHRPDPRRSHNGATGAGGLRRARRTVR